MREVRGVLRSPRILSGRVERSIRRSVAAPQALRVGCDTREARALGRAGAAAQAQPGRGDGLARRSEDRLGWDGRRGGFSERALSGCPGLGLAHDPLRLCPSALPASDGPVQPRGSHLDSHALTHVPGAMVVKTELCSFSGLRIYPGHGIFFVRSDMKSFKFLNRKVKAAFRQKANPRKIAWTMLYRRMHKKGTLEEAKRTKSRRVNKSAMKAVAGASLEVLKAKRNQKPEVRAAAREAALREVKERSKAKQATKKAATVPKGAQAKAPAPKQAKAKSKNAPKGVRR